MNSSLIQRRFNRSAAAGLYDTHARVQLVMAEWLARTIDRASDRLDILEIGCGTGVLTELLAQQFPHSSITALDIAPAMLEAADQRLFKSNPNGRPSVHWVQADIEAWVANVFPATFDLIVSSACLQWLSRPGETLRSLKQLLRPGGRFVFTTFGESTFRELHQSFDDAYRLQGKVPQKHGLKLHSIEQWQTWLIEGGFSEIQCQQSIQVQGYATVSEFLHSVKSVGASASEANAARRLSRRLLHDMYTLYEEKFRMGNGIAATYELLLMQASVPKVES